MFRLLVGVLMILTANSVSAITAGPFDGKMNNFTQFENSDFQVKVYFQCHKIDVDFNYDRDTVIETVVFNSDGTFFIPKLELNHLDLPSYLGCSLELYYDLIPQVRARFGGYANTRVRLSGAEIYSHDVMTRFTAVEQKPTAVNYVLSDGSTSLDFVTGLGKNFIATYYYDFTKITPQRLQYMATTNIYRWGSVYENSIGVTPAAVVFVPGLFESTDIPVSLKVEVKQDYQTMDQANVETTMKWGLPQQVLNFKIDTSKSEPMPLNGNWETKIIIDVALKDRKIGKLYFIGISQIACENGKLSGGINFKNWMSSPLDALAFPVAGIYQLNGTCQSEQEFKARLNVLYSDGSTKELKFSVDRIADCSTAAYCLLSRDNFGDNYNYPGANFSEVIKLKTTRENAVEGIIQIQRK